MVLKCVKRAKYTINLKATRNIKQRRYYKFALNACTQQTHTHKYTHTYTYTHTHTLTCTWNRQNTMHAQTRTRTCECVRAQDIKQHRYIYKRTYA